MLLALKLTLTPLLIVATTLAGRRWGAAVGGWLAGLPLTSAPISFLLCLQYGPEFAARAAIGNLNGYSAVAVYCLLYPVVAVRANGFISIVLSTCGYFVIAFLLNQLALSLWPALAIVSLTLVLILRWMPNRPIAFQSVAPPRWDMPLRVMVATALVLTLTATANALGPQLSGLLSTFPIYATVLAVFAHQQHGPEAAAQTMRGVVIGEFSAVTFFLIVGLGITILGLWIYPIASLSALLINGLSLRLVNASPTPNESPRLS